MKFQAVLTRFIAFLQQINAAEIDENDCFAETCHKHVYFAE